MIALINCDIFKSGADVICHQVNCQGVMGAGVAKQVREKYPLVYRQYKDLCNEVKDKKHLLGIVQKVEVDKNKYICNCFAQEDFGSSEVCHTDYLALQRCFKTINTDFKEKTVALPYLMGCYRGGGNWDIVSKIIAETLTDVNALICAYGKNEGNWYR